MTKQLTAELLAAGGVTICEVLIGPANEGGDRPARLHLSGADRDVWVEANAIDAVAVALHLDVVPPIWVCDDS